MALTKIDVWLQIAKDFGLYTPMFISEAPRKHHEGGRRENRTEPRAAKEGVYVRSPRGYLVRSKGER